MSWRLWENPWVLVPTIFLLVFYFLLADQILRVEGRMERRLAESTVTLLGTNPTQVERELVDAVKDERCARLLSAMS